MLFQLLEASENTEDKVDSDHETEPPDISFEELLAQEKKDMFWLVPNTSLQILDICWLHIHLLKHFAGKKIESCDKCGR